MQTPFPAYHGDQPYVFVCYAHDDASVVSSELQALLKLGVHIYYDEGISRGRAWTQELADAIDRCSHFPYFVSPASIASRNCRNEVQYALDPEKSTVSIHLEMTSSNSPSERGMEGLLFDVLSTAGYALNAHPSRNCMTLLSRIPEVMRE